MTEPGIRGVLIVVENLPVHFDRRVRQEATAAIEEAGYTVSVICPKGKGHTASYEVLGGIHIYRHSLPFEASSAQLLCPDADGPDACARQRRCAWHLQAVFISWSVSRHVLLCRFSYPITRSNHPRRAVNGLPA